MRLCHLLLVLPAWCHQGVSFALRNRVSVCKLSSTWKPNSENFSQLSAEKLDDNRRVRKDDIRHKLRTFLISAMSTPLQTADASRASSAVSVSASEPIRTQYAVPYYQRGRWVRERLEHLELPALQAAIITHFRKRCEERTFKGATDKMLNPLIVLPGTRATGKSTFLAHFPASDAYQTYAAEFGHNLSPVVSFLTYKTGHGGLGLRIIYGALAAMGYLDEQGISLRFTEFYYKYHLLERFSALDAIRLLEEVVGKERRILLLVDDVSKRIGTQEVCEQLGHVLDCHGNTNVIVSLTPRGMYELVTPSTINREVIYCAMSPLPPDHRWKQYKDRMDRMIAPIRKKYLIERPKHLDEMEFKRNILLSATILASGHPRIIQMLVREKEWQDILQMMVDPLISVGAFLRAIADVYCFGTRYGSLIYKEIDCLLSARRYNILDRKQLTARVMLGRPGCALYDIDSVGGCRFMFDLAMFIKMVTKWTHRAMVYAESIKEYKIQAASALFRTEDLDDIAMLWPRAVALTLAVRAYESELRENEATFSEITGTSNLPGTISRTPKVKFAPASESERVEWEEDTLVLSRPAQPGWDVMLCGRNNFTLLVDAKLLPKETCNLVDVVATKLKQMVADQVPANLTAEAEQEAFRRLVYVMWISVPENEIQALSLAEIKGYIGKQCAAKMKELSSTIADVVEKRKAGQIKDLPAATEACDQAALDLLHWERALRYVQQVFTTNVAVLGEEKIGQIMPPILQPIAALVRNTTQL